jgi:hypothetical protein
MKMLIIILALLIPQIAVARIGYSTEECGKRYGPPVFEKVLNKLITNYDERNDLEHVETTYQKNGYIIRCFFQGDAACWRVEYIKLDGQDISQKNINYLLGLVSDKWEKTHDSRDSKPTRIHGRNDDPFSVSNKRTRVRDPNADPFGGAFPGGAARTRLKTRLQNKPEIDVRYKTPHMRASITKFIPNADDLTSPWVVKLKGKRLQKLCIWFAHELSVHEYMSNGFAQLPKWECLNCGISGAGLTGPTPPKLERNCARTHKGETKLFEHDLFRVDAKGLKWRPTLSR